MQKEVFSFIYQITLKEVVCPLDYASFVLSMQNQQVSLKCQKRSAGFNNAYYSLVLATYHAIRLHTAFACSLKLTNFEHLFLPDLLSKLYKYIVAPNLSYYFL